MAQEKQYGLILPQKNKKHVAVPTSSKPKKNVFGEDSSEEDESNVDWLRKSLKERSHGSMQQKESVKVMKKALEDDPSVYEYDELYDDMVKKKEDIKEQQRGDRNSKYIEGLFKTAKQRELENELRKEREAQKEREKEGDMFQDKEAFVTSSYKKKMEDVRKMQEDRNYQDAVDDVTDVSKQKDMSGFYRYLYREKMKDEPTEKEVDSIPVVAPEIEQPIIVPTSPNPPVKSPSTTIKKNDSPPNPSPPSHRDTDPIRHDRRRRRSDCCDREKDKRRRHNNNSPSSSRDNRDNRDRRRRDRSSSRDRYNRNDDRRRYFDRHRRSRSRDRHRSRSPERQRHNNRYRSNNKDDREKDRSRQETGKNSPDSKIKIIQKENWYDFDVEIERDVKKSFYAKRTVGNVFDDALERYLERKKTNQILTFK